MRGELAGPPMASTRMVSARAWNSAKGLHPVRRQPAFRELRQVHFAPPVYLHRANFHSFGGENLFTIGVGGGVKSDLCDHSSAFSGAAPLDRLLRRRPGAWSVVTSTPSLLAWKMRARSTCPWSNGVLHPHRLLNQKGHQKKRKSASCPLSTPTPAKKTQLIWAGPEASASVSVVAFPYPSHSSHSGLSAALHFSASNRLALWSELDTLSPAIFETARAELQL